VFEETETETVNKVICQTEFRDECSVTVTEVCRNVTTGEEECQNIERFVCVDSMTNKCGIEKVLKNVSYTETVCQNKLENICEKEFVDGEAVPVEGSCVSKPTEECNEVTRFTEEFVDEDRCRDIPIKDCKNVQEEICSEKQELVCENLESENCEIVPHEECQHVLEKIPKKVSKKITKVVCDETDDVDVEPTEILEDDNTDNVEKTINVINDIFKIFGVTNNNENEIEDGKQEEETTTEFSIDDGLLTETTSPTTTSTTTTSTTTTTTPATTRKSTSTIRSSTVTDEFEDNTTETVRQMDGSKIIFSDEELEKRNKDLANRIYVNHVPVRNLPRTTDLPRRIDDPNSRIFFPE